MALAAGVAARMLWPGKPVFGYEWQLGAYLPSLGVLAGGTVLAALFASLGKTLADLDKLVRKLSG
jgi:hypothetical protein